MENMENPEPKSKSQIKRDHKAIQSFVRTLVEAPNSQLKKLPLSDYIIDEIRQTRLMQKGAHKRQIGFISKQMLDEPYEEAQQLFNQLQKPTAQANKQFHQLEKWRDGLIEQDEAVMTLLVDEYQADRQHIRRLVRNINSESEKRQPPRSFRLLFQYIKQLQQDQLISEEPMPDIENQ